MRKKQLAALALCLLLASGAALPAAAEEAEAPEKAETAIPAQSEEIETVLSSPENDDFAEPLEKADIPALQAAETPGSRTTASGTCGIDGENLTWALGADGVLTISGVGGMGNFFNALSGSNNPPPWYDYRDNVTQVIIKDGVTTIASSAFKDCSQLTRAAVPVSVTRIGASAFENCVHLADVSLSEGLAVIDVRAFYNCEALTGIRLPDSLTRIGGRAFENCSALTSLYLPDSLTQIGEYAFDLCRSLESVRFSDSLTYIGKFAFRSCTSLTSVDLPDCLTELSWGAFYNCTHLEHARLPQNITNIADALFFYCKSLSSIDIPEGTMVIENSSFAGCKSLTRVSIPKSVTHLHSNSFEGCETLKDVYYSGTKSQWDKIYFEPEGNGPLLEAAFHYAASATLLPSSSGGSLVALSLPGDAALPEGTTVLAVSLSGGRLTGAALGEVNASGLQASFGKALTPGGKLFFLEPETFRPLAKPAILE